ncbi:hypothetical protein ACA910_001908 [Epithemia clementina (nom. ined.)]
MDALRRRHLTIWFLLLVPFLASGDPISNAYIAFRTSPYDQEGHVDHDVVFPTDDKKRSRIFHSGSTKHDQCPLHFSLGISKRWHDNMDGPDINKPPLIRTVFPAAGPGKQVIYLTQYEHLDLLSPAFYEHKEGRAVQEALLQAPQFPMLWESSSFHVSPVLHDINGDGITDVIIADYDGGISAMGLAQEPGKSRYFHHFQTPRLHIRRDWIESRILKEVNGTEAETQAHRDPYHSYFEYFLSDRNDEHVLRGVTANVLDQDESAAKSLQERRSRLVSHLDDVKPVIEEHDESHHHHHHHHSHGEGNGESASGDSTSGDSTSGDSTSADGHDTTKHDNEHHETGDDHEHPGGEEHPNDHIQRDNHANKSQVSEENFEDVIKRQAELVQELKRRYDEHVVRDHEEHVHQDEQRKELLERSQASGNDQDNTGTDRQPEKESDLRTEHEQNHAEAQESANRGSPQGDANQHDTVQKEGGQEAHTSDQIVAAPKTNESQNSPRGEGGQEPEHQAEEQAREQHSQDSNAQAEQMIHTQAVTEKRDQQGDHQNTVSESNVSHQLDLEKGQDKQELTQAESVQNSDYQQEHANVKQTEDQLHSEENPAVDLHEKTTAQGTHDLGTNEANNAVKNEIQHTVAPKPDPDQPREYANGQLPESANKEEMSHHEEEQKHENTNEGDKHEIEIVDNSQDRSEAKNDIAQELHNGNQEQAEEIRHRRLEDLIEDEMAGELADDGLLGDAQTGDDMLTDSIPEEEDKQPEEERGRIDDEPPPPDVTDDLNYGRHSEDEYQRFAGYDDYLGDYHHDDYYDDKHYIRIPPHILSTPVLVEIPRLYGDNEIDDILLVVATYYFDEDEYEGRFSYKRFSASDHGDETELKRGMFVASAILAYNFDHSGRWSSQTHLDLSTDFSSPENVTLVGAVPIRADVTEMGAFALASPTVADIDGDGTLEVLVGTSMGMLYALECRNLFKKVHWPIQMKHPIESRPIVEDVRGDTNLEVFVVDIGGIVACFSHEAQLIWSRDILKSLGFGTAISGSSPLTLGDVDGDGLMDLVITVEVDGRWLIFAVQAASGDDVKNFPIELEKLRKTGKFKEKQSEGKQRKALAQPLLVDLHSNQDHMLSYIRRSTLNFKRDATVTPPTGEYPQGGSSPGLHIVQPLDKQLYIVEGGSGCTQKVVIGDEIGTMVQVDDIHGTNRLDLLVATKEGNVVTLESSTNYHPLNTWTGGDLRGKNSHAHGYSASQGIFVHEVSRQYSDIFGVYVPITFEIFDNRPNLQNEPEKKVYNVEVRDGSSSKRVLHRLQLKETGVYTERIYVRYGPGYYTLCVLMSTSHGITYEDCFATGYNVHFMAGFGVMLWLPLVVAFIAIFLCGVSKRGNWEDEDGADNEQESRDNRSLGILGRALPT